MIELIEDDLYYILKSSRSTLWCSKIDGSFSVHQSDDIMKAINPICLGVVHALIGKFRMGNDGDWKLLLVNKVQRVGFLPPRNSQCFKITQIIVLTLNPDKRFDKDQDIDPCPKHRLSGVNTKLILSNNFTGMKKPLQKKWNQFMHVAENIKPKKLASKLSPITQIISGVAGNTPNSSQRDSKEKEKFERRVMEELHRMFNEADSFYFTLDGANLTNNIQAMQDKIEKNEFQKNSWKLADGHYFWNKHMLNELIKLSEHNKLANEWILPMIQGYVQIEECPIKFEDEEDVFKIPSSDDLLKIKMCIISRRSRYRTGTRYKRRGVDSDGHTANFVETEQILEFVNHVVSFTQIRGSIPLYWSQSGIKYKPTPKIEKDFEQNHKAFSKHLHSLMDRYGDVKIISLIDQDGKEKIIGDVLLQHVISFNHPNISYVTFDFHEYCQGMKFENVSILTENVLDIIQDMKYCWVDKNGLICKQRGVFRVNCIDCLDRTNIVQSAFARIVLEMQFRKLGLLSPERQLSGNYKSVYQQMWANNGDVISRQYAGTAALKGDYTRTGERKLAGMMRDGVNSANRYFINQVKDVYRQATLDLMQGNVIIWESLDGSKADLDEGSESMNLKEEDLKSIIEDCEKLLIHEPEQSQGGWGLVNCERLAENIVNEPFADVVPQAVEMDLILLLSDTFAYVARYDDIKESVMSYQKIALANVAYIELGLISFAPKLYQLCFRLFYTLKGKDLVEDHSTEYNFYTLCLPGARLLNIGTNNIRNADEIKENLMSIAGAIATACKANGNLIKIEETKIDGQMKSKTHPGLVTIASQAQKLVDINLLEPLSSSHYDFTVGSVPGTIGHVGDVLGSEFGTNLFGSTSLECVQNARPFQSALKEFNNRSTVCFDHVCLPDCGILVIRSKNQLKLALLREAESFHYVNVNNYFETIHYLKQFLESRTDVNDISSFQFFLKKSSMLNKQNKSKSLDSSGMLQRIKKQVTIKPKSTLTKMDVLTEEDKKIPTDEVELDFVVNAASLCDEPVVPCLLQCEYDEQATPTGIMENKETKFLADHSADQYISTTNQNLHILNQMKNSKSENSFMDRNSSLNLLSNVDDFDFLEQSTSTALSKFKRKFVQLTLLSQQIGAPQTAQGKQPTEFEQMRKQAISNLMRSRLRFQYMKSQVILL